MISALPTPPSRQDPTNFNDRADAFLGALPQFQSEANTLQTDVNAKQGLAATSATNAAASELAAANTAGATIWVSGTTYAVGANRFSPINYRTYRRKTAGAGTTDPSTDTTNWQLLTGLGDVDTTSNQTITGVKTFSNGIVGNVNGNLTGNVTGNLTGNILTSGAVVSNLGYTPVQQSGGGGQLPNKVYIGWLSSSQLGLQVDSTNFSSTWPITASNASTVTTITTNQVLSATSGASVDAIGTYAFAVRPPNSGSTPGNALNAGSTVTGSTLRYASSNNTVSSTALSGTWRCMGFMSAHVVTDSYSQTSTNYGATLFLRIS